MKFSLYIKYIFSKKCSVNEKQTWRIYDLFSKLLYKWYKCAKKKILSRGTPIYSKYIRKKSIEDKKKKKKNKRKFQC